MRERERWIRLELFENKKNSSVLDILFVCLWETFIIFSWGLGDTFTEKM